MATSKYMKCAQEQIQPGKLYPCLEALELLKYVSENNKAGKRKFDESVELNVVLGIDAKKTDQAVRGATELPHGTGRSVRVAVMAEGTQADEAKAAGAEIVGYKDLVDTIKAGTIDFDVLIATPAAMPLVGQLGQILGPRGLMPNPKIGTVTPKPADAVKKVKKGQVAYRSEKGGIVHTIVGKVSFPAKQLKENLEAVLNDLKKLKPASSKGVFIKKIYVSSTMGPGLAVELSSLEA